MANYKKTGNRSEGSTPTQSKLFDRFTKAVLLALVVLGILAACIFISSCSYIEQSERAHTYYMYHKFDTTSHANGSEKGGRE